MSKKEILDKKDEILSNYLTSKMLEDIVEQFGEIDFSGRGEAHEANNTIWIEAYKCKSCTCYL